MPKHFKIQAEKWEREKVPKPQPADNEVVTVSFRVKGKVLKDMEYIIRCMGITKSKFIRSAIQWWSAEAEQHLAEESQKRQHLRGSE